MSKPIAVVTGAGSGIGRELARALAARDMSVLCVGRRADALAETAGADPDRLHPVAADIATDDGRMAIAKAVGERGVRYLVHNAGVLQPVGPLAEVDPQQWRYSLDVNVTGPLFLTRSLLERLRGGRVLHMSSGAAHRPILGWGAYCAGKAALHMISRVLHEELAGRGVTVGSVRPGVVDTPMQELIRQQDVGRFPGVEHFRALKREGRLSSPERVAAFVLAVLERTGDDEFGAAEWDFREHAAKLGL